MSTTEMAPLAVDDTAAGTPHGNRRPRVLAVGATVLLVAAAAAWWWLTTPRLEGGGIAGVSSEDHDVVMGSGMQETVFVVPADGPGSTTIAFGVRNTGRMPIELLDMWPGMEEPTCIWQPRERRLQDDPRYHGVLDDHARPVEGAVLAPGSSATVWLTGAHPDPAGCEHGAFSLHEDVEVVARIGGRVSTTRVPLGYTFGYADEPEMLRDVYEVRVRPPTQPAADG